LWQYWSAGPQRKFSNPETTKAIIAILDWEDVFFLPQIIAHTVAASHNVQNSLDFALIAGRAVAHDLPIIIIISWIATNAYRTSMQHTFYKCVL
jgi:hypothetical protein